MMTVTSRAFTLIELITVIAILGVLAVVVGPRFASTGVFEARTFYDDVLQAIRYAQAKASGTGCLTQIDFTASGFRVQVDSDCNSGNGMSLVDITSPDGFETGYTELSALPAGVTYSATVDPLVFDPEGRARNSSLAVLSATAQVTVGSETIRIDGATGYVR
jgi:MSHA pilin protein MshC